MIPQQKILIQFNLNVQLVNTQIKEFLIFSLPKVHNPSNSTIFTNLYQTFLLALCPINNPIQQNIVFIRHGSKCQRLQTNQIQEGYIKSQNYYGTFLRFVNLGYSKKLYQLLETFNVSVLAKNYNLWFCLYEVHAYKPANVKQMSVVTPAYGLNVRVNHSNGDIKLVISNLFRQNDQNFYFLSQPHQSVSINGMDLITSLDGKQIIGLTYKLNQTMLTCIPFHSILFQRSCNLLISPRYFSKLFLTCYIQFFGNYCTGILLSQTTLITTRHLLHLSHQKQGTQVFVRRFPYKQVIEGKVGMVGKGQEDWVLVRFGEEGKNWRQANNINIKRKYKEMVRLLVSQSQLVEEKPSSVINQINKFISTQDIFASQKTDKSKTYIGDQIVSIGFGKFSFSPSIFNKFQLCLPTIAPGIISKKIHLFSSPLCIFLKTDCKLYSGFSGCPLFSSTIVGMAVFILKNKNSNSTYNRHNYSYSMQFIQELIKGQVKVDDQQLVKFDKIQLRDRIYKVRARL